MARHIATPIQSFLMVSASKLGDTTRIRINAPGISRELGTRSGKNRRNTTATKAIHLPNSPLNKLKIIEGRVKKM